MSSEGADPPSVSSDAPTRHADPRDGDAERRLLPVTVRQTASAEQQLTYDVAVGIDLTLIFKRFGPLPAVVGTQDQTGPWNAVGRSRKPQLSDGSAAHEQITAWHPPWYFEYEVSGFTNILRLLVSGARGDWKFSPRTGGGTVITWTYGFRPLRGRKMVVRLLIVPLWRVYMRRSLARTVTEVERQAAL